MPRITPAQIVTFLHRSFPTLEQDHIGTVDQVSQQTLATLIAMLDSVPAEFVAELTARQYEDLLIAREYVRATVNRWQYPPPAGHLPHTIGPLQQLAARNPIIVLRDVMRDAPAEPIAAVQPRLAFLNDPELQESIATDIASAEEAISNGRYKNSCVMAGAAIEALLLWAVQRRSATDHQGAFTRAQASRTQRGRQPLGALDQDPRKWILEQYIEVGRELPVLSTSAADAAMLAKDFRNLIHPGRAERLQQKATRGSAAQGIAAVMLVVEDLAERAGNGRL